MDYSPVIFVRFPDMKEQHGNKLQLLLISLDIQGNPIHIWIFHLTPIYCPNGWMTEWIGEHLNHQHFDYLDPLKMLDNGIESKSTGSCRV